MTLIVSPEHFKSKADLKANLDSGRAQIHAPGFDGNWTKNGHELPVGFSAVVTNHPKRTKFANIKKVAAGNWEVK